MELKLIYNYYSSVVCYSSNRTFMELKFITY